VKSQPKSQWLPYAFHRLRGCSQGYKRRAEPRVSASETEAIIPNGDIGAKARELKEWLRGLAGEVVGLFARLFGATKLIGGIERPCDAI
jgi:hypothetical protein